MPSNTKPNLYRDVIDALAEECRSGQGQVSSNRVRNGLWNNNAASDLAPDQRRMNEILAGLSTHDRAVVADLFAREFEAGVYGALRVLQDFEIPPFESGYEGAPHNDLIGRLGGWQWPKS